jgi:hypothetical protein
MFDLILNAFDRLHVARRAVSEAVWVALLYLRHMKGPR